MKNFALMLLLLTFSGCAWINTGPKNPYLYPDMPKAIEPAYTSPRGAQDRDVCIVPEKAIELMKHEVDWQVTYDKMKAVIDAINRKR